MTYVAQFLKAYPNANDADIGADIGTADKEWQAYNSIMSWLNCDAVELLSSSSQPVADRQSMLLVLDIVFFNISPNFYLEFYMYN